MLSAWDAKGAYHSVPLIISRMSLPALRVGCRPSIPNTISVGIIALSAHVHFGLPVS